MRLEPAPGTVPPPGEWAERGACRGWPTEWWYPSEDRHGGRMRKEANEDAETAKRICKELCPVMAECLVHAVRYREPGIWGGTDPHERRQIRLRRAG